MFSIEVAASKPIEQSDKQENTSSSYTHAAANDPNIDNDYMYQQEY